VKDAKEWFKEAGKAIALFIAELTSQTCKVRVYTWRETFAPQGDGQWLNHRSTGCGVRISTLQHDRQKRDLGIVTYETREVVTKREDPLCHDVKETLARYALLVPPRPLACECITFDTHVPDIAPR